MKARYLPVQCGTTENEMALFDLKRAYELAPNDKLITKYFLSSLDIFSLLSEQLLPYSNDTFTYIDSAYFQLKKELDSQRKKDLTTFGGLFDRGTIYKQNEPQSSFQSENIDLNNMTIGDVLKKIRDMKSTAKSLYDDGKAFESNQLMERANSLQKEIEEYQASLPKNNSVDWLNIDYNNPTPEVIEMTTQMGLDLQDPR